MATTTPKTRANTKTTKTRTTKTSAAKTTQSKTVKATKAAPKAAAKKVTKVTKPVVQETKSAAKKVATAVVSPLRTLHAFSALVSAALLAAAVTLMNNVSVPVTATYLVRDEVTSELRGTTVFATAVRNLYDAAFKWELVVLLAVSLIFSLLLATRLQNRVRNGVDKGVVGARWLEAAIVVGLMFEIGLLAGGVTDILVIKLVFGLVALSAALGYLAERQRARNGTLTRSLTLLSLLSFLLPTLLVIITTAFSGIFGMVRLPWFVYALYGVLILSTALAAIMLRRRIYRVGQFNDALYAEKRFAVLGIATKVIFAVILIIGLQK